MTRPQIIRADTIDLQDQNAPSAKDHSRQPTTPAALGDGPPAPHQASALRSAGFESIEHHSRSPRDSRDLSGKELQLLHDELAANGDDGSEGDHLGLQRNGAGQGQTHEDGDMGDQDGDDSMDDDMMDKISSSPSIDSGGYPLPWLNNNNAASPLSAPQAPESPLVRSDLSDTLSSSPFVSAPAHFPLSFLDQDQDFQTSDNYHLLGEFSGHETDPLLRDEGFSIEARHHLTPLISESGTANFRGNGEEPQDSSDADFNGGNLHDLLLPSDDPLLDNIFDDCEISHSHDSAAFSPRSPSLSWDDDQVLAGDDNTEDVSFVDSRFVDSGWGGECLREIEDISFDFVYALHTFVATVEGQANATKGDTMVLLDDTNSYWWLVRVVKDSSIGYLPAEHIETPTERLARLNKHRNIDLSQTMLGDNPEKSKNPLKKAMRRRNAKTVQFAPPTYYDPSDNDYSSDEEGDEGEFTEISDAGGLLLQSGDPQVDQDEDAVVEPLNIKAPAKDIVSSDGTQLDLVPQPIEAESEAQFDKSRSSEELCDHQDDGTSGKPRRPLVRNTDSFFKDDTGETRKINLTPSLLRDDSGTATAAASETKDTKTRGSLDTLEKAAIVSEKPKDEKRKEKKPGMLSGLFKRKDKKNKYHSEDEDSEWVSKESSGSPKVSSDSMSQSQDVQPIQASPQPRSPQRQTSKLQKPPPLKTSSSSKRPPSRDGQMSPTRMIAPDQSTSISTITERSPSRSLEMDRSEYNEPDSSVQPTRVAASSLLGNPLESEPLLDNIPSSPIEGRSRGGMFSPIRDALRSSPSASEPKVEKVKKAKERMPMDDFDSSPEAEVPPTSTLQHPIEEELRTASTNERLSESPVYVSPVVHPSVPPLVGDNSSQEDPNLSPISPSSTPELVDIPPEESVRDQGTPVSTNQSTRTLPTWSDAGLRTYLEDDTDVRDLLVVVHDKTNLKPAGPDHHVVKNLCKDENQRLDNISSRLDGLLRDLLARKSGTASR